MRKTATLSLLALATVLYVGIAAAQDAIATKAPADVAAKPIIAGRQLKGISQADLKWETDPETKVAMAVVSGDPKTGAYEAFLKFPAGMEIPLHWHTFSNTGVGVSGNLVVEAEGQRAIEIGAGAWGFVPGRLRHTTKCGAGADCVLYVRQPGKSDTHSVKPPAKK